MSSGAYLSIRDELAALRARAVALRRFARWPVVAGLTSLVAAAAFHLAGSAALPDAVLPSLDIPHAIASKMPSAATLGLDRSVLAVREWSPKAVAATLNLLLDSPVMSFITLAILFTGLCLWAFDGERGRRAPPRRLFYCILIAILVNLVPRVGEALLGLPVASDSHSHVAARFDFVDAVHSGRYRLAAQSLFRPPYLVDPDRDPVLNSALDPIVQKSTDDLRDIWTRALILQAEGNGPDSVTAGYLLAQIYAHDGAKDLARPVLSRLESHPEQISGTDLSPQVMYGLDQAVFGRAVSAPATQYAASAVDKVNSRYWLSHFLSGIGSSLLAAAVALFLLSRSIVRRAERVDSLMGESDTVVAEPRAISHSQPDETLRFHVPADLVERR